MKNRSLRFLFLAGLFLCLILITTCKELEKSMLVATDEATNVLTNSADLPGQIIDLGGGATQYGHYYGKSDNPTASHTTLGAPNSITGFTSQVTGLEAGTKYLFKAYITDGQETVFGKEKSFTTVAASAPALTTTAITSITLTGAVSGGNITSDGGAPVTARGVCWNNFTAPTISNNKTTDASGTGTFTSTLTGLTAGSTYFVRAYATNSAGTTYGNEVTFTTTAASVPTVTTNIIANISYNGALGGGEVISDGGSPVLARGVCWSTATGPTVSNTKTTNGSGTGSFSSDISALSPTTKYYVRAYATNIVGTAYGSEVSFTTSNAPVQLPVITTVSPGNITSISATSGGDITSDGGSAVTSRGVCWNGTGSPTLGGNQTVDGSGTGSFASTLTGLAPNTKYYVRAYAVNAVGTAYGNEYNFTTLSASSAVVSTTAITSITQTTASGGGNITSDGGSAITVRGICWSLNQNPTLADSFTDNGTGTGIFNSQLTNLSPGKTYYVRAYATNVTGTTYGNQVSFLTASDIPKVTTSAIGTVTATTAQAGGEVLDNNGSTVTTRGICYNTTGSPTITDNVKSESAAIGVFSLSLTGLTPNTTYYIRAFATNAIGTAYGAQIQFATPISSATITTTAVTSITTTTATSGGVISADGGSSITARGVCWSTSTNPVTGTATMTNDGTGLGSFTSALTGLSPNTKYYIRAYAINGFGTTYGDELTFTTSTVTGTVPGAPTGVSAAGGNGQAVVTFSAPASDGGSAITGYTVTSSPSGFTGTGSSSPITVASLINGTSYTFTVTATNAIGTGPASTASNSVTPSTSLTVAGAPTGVSATAGYVQAVVSFTAPANNGGSAITGYTVTSSPGGFVGTGSLSPITVTGLPALISYTFTVTATNAIGTGPASSASNAVTPTTVPDAPIIGTATKGNAQATVAFTAPVGNGGSAITGYTVTSNPGGITGTGTASPVIVPGLTNGTSYTFTATATNANGTSAPSASSNSVTPLTVPLLTTTTVTSVTSVSALSGGSITSDGGSSVSVRGVCWGLTTGPTISGSKTSDGSGSGAYISSITGLAPSTKYYVRAYATNSEGTSYGNEIDFTTTLMLATLTTTNVTALSTTSATSGGEITSDGGSAVTNRGICWSTTANPTILDNTTNSGSGIGVFTSTITGLSPNTTYHLRAYATTGNGTSYGSDLTFTTTLLLSDIDGNTYNTVQIGTQLWMKENLKTTTYRDGTSIPNVTDNTAWSNLSSGAYSNFNNDPGNAAAYGRLYNYWANVDNHNLCPSGWHVPTAGEWTILANYLGGASVAGGKLKEAGTVHWLSPNQGADNSSGFTALPAPARYNDGTFSSNNYITAFWVPLETDANNANYKYMNYSEASLNNGVYLKKQGYSVRCLQGEGQLLSAVTTTAISAITTTTASSGGNVTSDGGASVTARGVCWSTAANPTISDSHTTNGSGTGAFTSSLTSLTENTTYHVRAYATNSIGTAYGSDVSFTTVLASSTPTVSTTTPTSITGSTASSGGNVTADGGAPVSSKGVCWSASPNPTTANPKTIDGTGLGTFTSSITGLTANTIYHVRAYATNVAGTAYGSDIQFTTTAPALATITTTAISALYSVGATSGGNVTSEGGAAVTARGVCWGTSINPTVALATKTINGTGPGIFESSLTGLSQNTIYFARAYATNSVGTAYGSQVSFTTPATVTDYDGNVYNVVKIGTQFWMRENLKVTHYRNGNSVPLITDLDTWNGLSTGAYCVYDDNEANATVYGRLYNYFAAIDSRNICPTGYHVSSDAEWSALETYLGISEAGIYLKEAGTAHWVSYPGALGTNSSGFTGLPGGVRYQGMYSSSGMYGHFLTSTGFDATQVYSRYLGYFYHSLQSTLYDKTEGQYIRCLKD